MIRFIEHCILNVLEGPDMGFLEIILEHNMFHTTNAHNPTPFLKKLIKKNETFIACWA